MKSLIKNLKLIKRIVSYPDFWPIAAVVLVALLAARGLIGSGYFNMHDDLQMMRQLQMEKCFLDGQIPCRWVPDMGYGYGFPLFNFYPPLPYLVGEIFRLVGFSFVDVVKILFVLSFVLSGITMYFLAKEFFGRFGGFVSAAFYIWAPYHAVDVYVRGAMNEAWAMIWFPLIFLASYRILRKRGKLWNNFLVLSVSWAFLFLSHNLMVMIFTPFFALWCGLWLLKERNVRAIPSLVVSGVLGFGLAAFFVLPVLVEKDLVQTDSLAVGYYEFTAHFVNIHQLLTSRFWGYGPSVWQDAEDMMSFQIGIIHWVLPIILLIFLLKKILRKRESLKDYEIVFILSFFVGWFFAFMTHSRSTPIWQSIESLKFVQFPWRFLTLVIFSFSLSAGVVSRIFKAATTKILGIILIIAIIVYSFNYFMPQHGKLGPLTDEEKFSGAAWELQQTAGIYDYLPKTAKTAPKAPRLSVAEVMKGEASIIEPESGTNWARFGVDSLGDSLIRINIFSFPDFVVFVNDVETQVFIAEDEEWGRMYINVPSGVSRVYLKLYDTNVRKIGNLISAFSLIVSLLFIL